MAYDVTQYTELIAKINAVKKHEEGAPSAQDVLKEVEAFVPKRFHHMITTTEEMASTFPTPESKRNERPLYILWFDAQGLVRAQPIDPHAVEREEMKEAKRLASENAAKNAARITAMEGAIINAFTILFDGDNSDLRVYFQGVTLKLTDAGVYELRRAGVRGPKGASSNGTGRTRTSGEIVHVANDQTAKNGTAIKAGDYDSFAALMKAHGYNVGVGVNAKRLAASQNITVELVARPSSEPVVEPATT